MLNIPSTNTDPSYRYKMPKLVSKVEGRGNGIKTAVMNVKEVAAAIHRPPGYVMKWFGCELGAKSSYEEKESQGVQALVQGAHTTQTLQELLDKFLGVYVLCPTCGLPELDLKLEKKREEINGTCKACGFNGNLLDATCHKMAAFAFKNPIGGSAGDEDKAKKRTKSQRRALKNARANGGDDAGDEEVQKKKKKKKAESDGGSDDDGEKKKKKKKEKKAKKARSDSDDGNDTIALSVFKFNVGRPSSSSNGSPAKEDDMTHKSDEVIDIIQKLTTMKEGPVEEFVEEARLMQISAQAERKMLMYAVTEALFEGQKLSGKKMEEYSKLYTSLVKGHKASVKEIMWGFEMYVHEHEESLKAMPMICKALYDMDILEEENFMPYYQDSKANSDNPGHAAVHKAVEGFANWLGEDNSDSDSDSD